LCTVRPFWAVRVLRCACRPKNVSSMSAENTVLFVDDEEFVLTSLERYLIRESYARRYANSGEAALAIMASEPIDVVVSDMRMPGMAGMELLRIIKERWPDTIRIALSAHVSSPQLLAAINTGEVYRYLTKPLQPVEEIRAEIRNAIELHQLRRKHNALILSLAERNQQLEDQLARIRTLEGLLPICAYCKKIRDDKGYWQMLEQYITEHSCATFSHGMCPDCYAREMQALEDETVRDSK